MALKDEVGAMDHAELIETKLRVDALLRDAKQNLQQARATVASTGKFLPPNEYQEMLSRVNRLSGASQRLQIEIGRRGKAVKEQKHSRLEQKFIDACRRELAPELFARLWAQASTQ